MKKISKEDWKQLRIKAFKLKEKQPYLRIGQCFFNLLYETNPELADSVRGTSNDPFHSDDYTSLVMKRFYDSIVEPTNN